MARANLPRALEHVFGHEGGLSLDPKDRGNWTDGNFGRNGGTLKGTKFGIAAHVYPGLDIRNLTLADAAKIYERDYWAKIRGDLLRAGIDVVAFDAAINSGPSRAVKWLQKTVGTKSDGAFGPITAAAVEQVTDWVAAIKTYCSYRLSFLEGLTGWARYGRGWSRRVAENEAFGIAVYLESRGRPAASIAAAASVEEAAADDSRRRNTNAARGTGAVTVADGGAMADRVIEPAPVDGVPLPVPRPDPDTVQIDASVVDWIVGGAFVAGLILLAFFMWRAHAQKQRRNAYHQVAKGA